MSVYRCEECEDYFDSDFEGVEEDPRKELIYICESCYEKLLNFKKVEK